VPIVVTSRSVPIVDRCLANAGILFARAETSLTRADIPSGGSSKSWLFTSAQRFLEACFCHLAAGCRDLHSWNGDVGAT